MRAVFNTDSAVPADNRQGIFTGKMDGLYNTGVSALSALNAFFFIMDNTAAFPICQSAGRTGNGAGPLTFAGQAMYREKFTGKAAYRAHLDGAFGIGIAFMVHTGAYTLAGKASDTFVHVIGFQNFAH